MTLPVAPSSISFSQLAAELGNACTNISLRDYSQCAALSSPDAISELYGKTCTPIYGSGAWTTRNSMSIARNRMGLGGTQNAAVVFGGYGAARCRCTESYNGTNWSSGGLMANAMYGHGSAGSGTQNAALGFGGYVSTFVACTEAYNGTSWAGRNAMSNRRYAPMGLGVQNSTIAAGGYPPGWNATNLTELYNGSSWSTSNALPSACGGPTNGAGVVNAGLFFTLLSTTCTLSYNGTNWSSAAAMSVARSGASGNGSQNDVIVSGGEITGTRVGCTELYNGTSWSSSAVMNFARNDHSTIGSTSVCALSAAGYHTTLGNAPTYTKVTCTEAYTASFLYNGLR